MDITLTLNTPWVGILRLNGCSCEPLSRLGNGKQGALPSSDDPAYDEYVDEVENMRHRNKGSSSLDLGKVLSHLGLPEYEYVDAQNYDYLLPTHLTYGKDQTVKLHNAKIMSCESRCCALSLPAVIVVRHCSADGLGLINGDRK